MLKSHKYFSVLGILLLLLTGCTPSAGDSPRTSIYAGNTNGKVKLDYSNSDFKKIYFAGGCFWGVEAYLDGIYGVAETTSGYANGTGENPSYEEVISGDEGFAETVEVSYDPNRISLEELLDTFFKVIDPTSVNKQGNDKGVQYRTGIYFTDEQDSSSINAMIAEQQKYFKKPIATEVLPLKNYYLAEDFHQDYLEKNPNGYCHINLNVLDQIEIKSEQYKRPTDAVLQNELTDQQLRVTVQGKTEKAFDNAYYNTFEPGIYVDISTGEPLFVSNDKYDADTGYPTFFMPILPEVITLKKDATNNNEEVRSRVGDIYLGQLFYDGPKEQGGNRYSINSAALRFIPIDEMKQQGYGHLVNIIR